MPSEFALIDRHFKRPTRHTVCGVGDDAALIRPAPGHELAISTDMLVAGTHFFPDADPADLGWKVLAVNVSDMAAMGAQPKWALLAAALPEADDAWIGRFVRGFFECADAFGIDVIGGDTTKSSPVGPACAPGPQVFCVTIFGEMPTGEALLRSGARPGDDIWVSGTPGRAALGLAHMQGTQVLPPDMRADCLRALHRPQPRVALGLALRGLASAAIDVSDGLLADLGHILSASGVSARLTLPVLPPSTFWGQCYLAGGDDYELVFTLPPGHRERMPPLAQSLDVPLTCIGRVETGPPGHLLVFDAAGQPVPVTRRGYDHFGETRSS